MIYKKKTLARRTAEERTTVAHEGTAGHTGGSRDK